MAGSYATTSELQARFNDTEELVQLTRNVDANTIDAAVLAEALQYAEGVINSYAGKLYAVPLDVGGDTGLAQMIKSTTLDIASWFLLSESDLVSEPRKARYDNAILWLEKVAAGDVVLPSARTEATSVSVEPDAVHGTAGTSSSSLRKFSRDTMEAL